jgi:hypothetical protein
VCPSQSVVVYSEGGGGHGGRSKYCILGDLCLQTFMDVEGGWRSGVDLFMCTVAPFGVLWLSSLGSSLLQCLHNTMHCRELFFSILILGDSLYTDKFIKRLRDARECVNVILLYSNNRYVSATHVAVCRVARTGIQPQL